MHRPLPHAPGVLAENRRHYELLVEMARHYAGQGNVEHTLRAATGAANYAWLAPVGLLSDVRLERIVVHAVRGSGSVTVDGSRRGGRVLHVLSEAYSIGGHTRLAWRWMSRDDRPSDVVLTNQRGPVPDRLVDSVRQAGGDLHDLRPTAPGLLHRAHALRELMDRADLVVLHVHPYDVVALAAVNLPGVRPPVIYENHADLSFWLGVAGADLVCDWRDDARALDVDLRGVAGERIGVLPMPVDAMPSSSGGDLRRVLGIDPDAVVALTVSADWKMAASWGRGMPSVVDRLLYWTPKLAVVLVGATPSEEWARLCTRYPGRVFPVGMVPDPAPYFDLADVYIESYPTRAGTSPLEAAVLGLPVVALADVADDNPAHIFQTGSPGLVGFRPSPTPDKFALAVRRLALDPDLRRRQGADVRAAVLAVHDGPGWRASLESLYDRARALAAVDVDELDAESTPDDRYGAMLLSATAPGTTSPDPRRSMEPLGDLADDTLKADLLAALCRGLGPTLQVRVGQPWQQHEAWTSRLLELTSTHPRLSVSLPFLPDDGTRGERTAACLTALLSRSGRTPDDCGDISVDSLRPSHAGPELGGDLPFTDATLDTLEQLLGSPLWSHPADADRVQPSPAPLSAGAAASA